MEGIEMRVALEEGAHMPERAHETDAGLDLRCREAFTLYGRGSATVDTGVRVELPPGTCGLVVGRSGLDARHGVTAMGLVDEGYTGTVRVTLHNHLGTARRFEAGDRVAQLVVLPLARAVPAEVSEIGGGARGDAGLGSTGR